MGGTAEHPQRATAGGLRFSGAREDLAANSYRFGSDSSAELS